jgi:hypothetical protein
MLHAFDVARGHVRAGAVVEVDGYLCVPDPASADGAVDILPAHDRDQARKLDAAALQSQLRAVKQPAAITRPEVPWPFAAQHTLHHTQHAGTLHTDDGAADIAQLAVLDPPRPPPHHEGVMNPLHQVSTGQGTPAAGFQHDRPFLQGHACVT